MTPLEQALREIARTPLLLVACDFDGTLADIVPNPADAVPGEMSVDLLKTLAAMPHTHSAVISGRSLDDLSRLLNEPKDGQPGRPRLIGSHGIEGQGGVAPSLNPSQRDLLCAARRIAEDAASRVPGSIVETKPASVTFHYRRSDPALARTALDEIHARTAGMEGLHRLSGHKVIELAVLQPDKGKALEHVRRRTGASRVMFVGDDVTDEAAFAVLRHADVGVKIGPGETRAAHRIESRSLVRECLRIIRDERAHWLESRRLTPIERHSLLSDQRTLALVDPHATLVWCCLPRIDSPAMFAHLLGAGRGIWEIYPEQGGEPVQEYLGDTFMLRTRWPAMTVTDYFDCSAGRAYQRAGRSELIRVVEGTGKAIIRFAPRLDFGRMATRLVVRDGSVEIERWPDPVVLVAPGVSWNLADDGPHQTAVAEIDLAAGPRILELRYGTSSLRSAGPEPERRRQTERFWSGWASTLELPSLKRDLVRRSALVLKALVHGPTGAIAAAGTTSLPEHLGGERNWDYRFCWPRDASLAASALVRLGNTGIAMKFVDWMAGVVERLEAPDRLRPVYTVTGSNLSPEAEIGELPGYGDSRPVRVGNAAAYQVQLDVFGPIVETVALLAERGAPITPEHWRLVEAMVQAVASRWKEPDNGIWEIRGPRRHHVHTKAMCWLAVSCAVKVADLGMGRRRSDWEQLRDQIAADILEHGYNEKCRAFTAAYAEESFDASALAVGLTGIIDPTDERFINTVAAIEHQLRRGRTVYRYLTDDGLAGEEGGWFLCTWWLIESMVMSGRRDDARALFDQMCDCAGHTGLLAEEYDPGTGLALGNFPQAYSHIAVINSALAIERADTSAPTAPGHSMP